MTASEFSAMKLVATGGMPFASGENATVTAPSNNSGNYFCVPNGFGTAFDSAPADDGSNMVQRGQMNYIGKMASYSPFFFQCGGYYTFDPAVATNNTVNGVKGINGYPKGAILWTVDGITLIPVMSLVENNRVDFTGNTDRTLYTDITNGSIDGVNWVALVANEGVTEAVTLAEVNLGVVDGIELVTMSMNVASGVLPRAGALSVFPTFGTMTKGSAASTTFSLTLYYTEPGGTEQSIILLKNQDGESGAATSVSLKSGTIYSLIFALGNLKFDSVKFTVTLV